jgi:hypothetical protein
MLLITLPVLNGKSRCFTKLSNIGHYYGTRHALQRRFDKLLNNNYSISWAENARRNSPFCSFSHKGPKLGFFFLLYNKISKQPSIPTARWI